MSKLVEIEHRAAALARCSLYCYFCHTKLWTKEAGDGEDGSRGRASGEVVAARDVPFLYPPLLPLYALPTYSFAHLVLSLAAHGNFFSTASWPCAVVLQWLGCGELAGVIWQWQAGHNDVVVGSYLRPIIQARWKTEKISEAKRQAKSKERKYSILYCCVKSSWKWPKVMNENIVPICPIF